MIQGVFNFPDQVAGTTLHAREFEIEGVETELVSARLVFYKDGALTLEPTITILSNTDPWLMRMEAVDASDMNLETGIHAFTLQTVDENGELGTEKYITGIMEIKPSAPFPEAP